MTQKSTFQNENESSIEESQSAPEISSSGHLQSSAVSNSQMVMPTSLSSNQEKILISSFSNVWANLPNKKRLDQIKILVSLFCIFMVVLLALSPDQNLKSTEFAYKCPGSIENPHSKVCEKGVQMSKGQTFRTTVKKLTDLNQSWSLVLSLFNKMEKSCPSAEYNLQIETSLYGFHKSDHLTPLAINQTANYPVVCFEDSETCDSFPLIWEEYIEYPNYHIDIRFISAKIISDQDENEKSKDECKSLLEITGDVEFSLFSVNPSYTIFIIVFKTSFFILSLVFFLVWIYHLKSTTGSLAPGYRWGFETNMVFLYAIGCILNFNPFFPIEILTVSTFSRFMKHFIGYISLFILIFYWSTMFDWSKRICKLAYFPPLNSNNHRQPFPQQYHIVSMKRFFLPKILISFTFTTLSFILFLIVSDADSVDPIRGMANEEVSGAIVVFSIALVLIYLAGAAYILCFCIMISQTLSRISQEDLRNRTLTAEESRDAYSEITNPIDRILSSELKDPKELFLAIPILPYRQAKSRYRSFALPTCSIIFSMFIFFALPNRGVRYPAFAVSGIISILFIALIFHFQYFLQVGKVDQDWSFSWTPQEIDNSNSSSHSEHSGLLSQTDGNSTSYISSDSSTFDTDYKATDPPKDQLESDDTEMVPL